MSNILDNLVKQCLIEVLSERKNQDPTKEEMIAFLQQQFGREDGFSDDAEAAMYWFANFNHGGQDSNLYSVPSTLQFRPGRLARGPLPGSAKEMMFQALESQFGSGEKAGEVDETDTHLSGMRKDAARPAGSTVIDATVAVMGNSLQISTSKGHLTISLTPEQIAQLKVELVDLSEATSHDYPDYKDGDGRPPSNPRDPWAMKNAKDVHRPDPCKKCGAKWSIGHKCKVKETSQPEPFDPESDTFQPSPRDRTEPVPPVEKPLEKEAVGQINPAKLSNSERKKIGAAFTKAGLDGNGRFEKKEHGLSAITDALSSLGFQLDMVSADLIMGDKGQRNLSFRRANDPGADPFSEKPEIENSRIAFVWEALDRPSAAYPHASHVYEILAYAS